LALYKPAVKRATERIDLSVGEDDIRQMKSRDKRYALPWMTLRRDHDESSTITGATYYIALSIQVLEITDVEDTFGVHLCQEI